MNRKKEIAKFLSGAMAYHALVHAALLAFKRDPPMRLLGITYTPTLNASAAIVSVALSIMLGWYAWGRRSRSREGR